MKQLRPYPQVVVSRKAAKSLATGHPWVFADEVRQVLPAPLDGRTAQNGDLVDVVEENGTWQGAGLISEQSTIRVRIVTRNANDRMDEAFWARKLAWAWDYRRATMGARALPGTAPDTDCCRVLFSEADGFPGLVVDRYGDVLVAQVGTVGMERLRHLLYPLLLKTLQDAGEDVRWIYERNDGSVRTKEGLPLYKGWWQGEKDGLPDAPPTQRIITENGIRYDVDIERSQKTGFFLDQKYNRRAVRELAHGRRVLDCFCHVGPFGLNAARGGAAFVREVDVSETALNLARANARLNGLLGEDEDQGAQMGFTQADVLEYLPQLARDKARLREEGGPFDLIVLDPPAFTKSRDTVRHALKGYREINHAALRLLPRGGYLATCSCSHFMAHDLLVRAISEAAHDAGCQLRQVEDRQQAPDHPILWGVPESHYLDFFVLQKV